MDLRIIALLVMVIVLFSMGFLVYFRNRKNAINISYGLFIIFMAVWSFGLAMFYSSQNAGNAFFWTKFLYSAGSFIATFFFYFSLFFPFSKTSLSLLKRFLIFIPSIVLFFLFFFSDFILKDVAITSGVKDIIYGPGHILFDLQFDAFFIVAFVSLFLKFRASLGRAKTQLRYVILGTSLGLAIAGTTNVILPWFGVFQYLWIGPEAATIWIAFNAYAILKHRLMDIRLVIARSIAYSALIIVLGFIYTGGLFLLSSFLSNWNAPTINIAASTFLALIIAFSFQPLLNFFKKITDRIFYKEIYDETEVVHDLALIMASTIYVHDLTQALLNKILTKLHIKRGAFILLENEKIFHLAFEGYGQKPEFGEEDLYKFSQESRIIIFDELPENPFKELMQKFGISVIVPLRTKTEFDDILILGEKLSGGPYTNQDIRLLEIFAPEAAVAIANASAVARMTRLDELKSEFITVVSHQLRTPLSVARWNFELLLEQAFGRLPKKAHNIAQDIYQTLMVLNQGLNNLMSALEIEEGKLVMRFEDIEINKEVIEDTIAGFNREIRSKKIVLKSRLSFKGIVTADRQKLKKVFEVILDNAIRYSPSGSELTISTIRQSKKLRSELLISIEDEGIGILKKNREFLFQKFFRGDEAKKMSPGGFGLGLFIAKEYIEAHGGQLWAEGKEGGGSIFYFTIPVKE